MTQNGIGLVRSIVSATVYTFDQWLVSLETTENRHLTKQDRLHFDVIDALVLPRT